MDVEQFIAWALESSIYVQPKEDGLDGEELLELGRRFGFHDGETERAIRKVVGPTCMTERRYRHASDQTDSFTLSVQHDERDARAFDYVITHLKKAGEHDTQHGGRPWVPRDVVVAAGCVAGLKEHNVEVAVTMQVHHGYLDADKEGRIKLTDRGERTHPAVLQVEDRDRMPDWSGNAFNAMRPEFLKVREAVRDRIEARTDGRPKYAEPIPAFGETLTKLGYPELKLWWAQTGGELRISDPATAPTTVCVLAGSMMEASLIFLVKYARSKGVTQFSAGALKSDEPKEWKVPDLVKAAGNAGIIDEPLRKQAEILVGHRQRIHVGRLMSENPHGSIPDLKPEQARAAKSTLDLVLRALLEWLETT